MFTPWLRIALAALVVALLAIVAPGDGPTRLATPASALGTEAFVVDPTGQLHPPKLYEGDPSHGVLTGTEPADANPAGGTNGYCIRVIDSETVAASIGDRGFTVASGENVIDDSALVIDTDYYDAGTPQRTDDVYCAVVQAGMLESNDLNGTMFLEWTYTDGVSVATIRLKLDVFRIDLAKVDGFVGGAAEVCTVNWDPGVMTGRASNDGTLPDATDEVTLGNLLTDADWVITGGAPPVTLDKLGLYRDGDEWCMTFTADGATSGVSVTFLFDPVYRLATNVDDTQHEESILLNFTLPDYSELRHVSPGGQLISSFVSPVNVVGSYHPVCIIPSTPDDTLSPADIRISGDEWAVADIFYNDQATRFPGVPEDTLCFTFTSREAGEQTIEATFTYDVGGANERRIARWDTNGDGNGDPVLARTPLVKRWDTIAKTEITRGTSHWQNRVTDSSFSVNLVFNVADGTYSAGSIDLVEWVYGSGSVFATDPEDDVPVFLDGVYLSATITGKCGYFVVEPPPAPFDVGFVPFSVKSLEGRSVAGRFDVDPMSYFPDGAPLTLADGLPDDVSISITNDPACNVASTIELQIDAYYPSNTGRGEYFGTETVKVTFQHVPAMMTPRVAWAGQRLNTTFAFGGGCAPYDGATITFTRGDDQPGTFLPGPGTKVEGPGEATGTFSEDDRPGQPACSFTVGYESEEPGEVDITVFFSFNNNVGRIDTTKVVFPVFFLVMEDVVVTASEDLVVSARGDVSATVRGWFPGTNPSGRDAVTFPDGRSAPRDRWVLPDDWAQLRGDAEFRPSWPASAPMPITGVTFVMEDESVRNAYPYGPEDKGAAGWFLLDGTEYSINVNPHTGQPSALGSVLRPRIISDLTDNDGVATVDSVGDLNLSFEECPANEHTLNPHCGVDNVVGRTRYYAIADYPNVRTQGKHPPARSNVAETVWRWAGYKQVTVLDGEVPGIKYVVAHLKDRDGFCDAAFQNNTLGIKVDFVIDSGGGRIIEVAGDPSEIAIDNRGAVGTTLDTHDDDGNVINAAITKTALADDECQAWVRVSNSLLSATNVVVTFPAQPAPVPDKVRITSLQCSTDTVTVTNTGDSPVSLAGFALRSRRNDIVEPEQHLGLSGLLQPGQSKTYAGAGGWLPSSNRIFNDGGPDYARLVWNEFEINRVDCNGGVIENPLPSPLPRDGEVELVVDVLVDFGAQSSQPLVEGWNLVTVSGKTASIDTVVGQEPGSVIAVYGFDAATGQWERFIDGAPAFASTLHEMEAGAAYWVLVKQPFTLTFP